MGKRGRKKRTHVKPGDPAAEQNEKNAPPKSFVVRSGPVGSSVSRLTKDLRKLMEPNTAARLRERHSNRLRDFVNVAGQLGVTHLMIFSRTDNGTNLRIGRTPRGPTLTFKVHNYSLMKDILASQRKPRSPGSEYLTSPLLVLNNFNATSSDGEKSMKLMTSMFQNMFPAIDVQKMHLSEARRVLLLNYNSETGRIDFRHYTVGVRPVGISKSVKKIIAPGAMASSTSSSLPNLNAYDDIAEYVLREAAAAESEAEDGDATVELGQNFVGRGNRRAEQRAVRLTEVGPRMELELTKIQVGLCSGEVLFHRYVTKSTEEAKSIAKARQKKIQETARRRAEQEKNVEKKKRDKEEAKAKSKTNEGVESVEEENSGDDMSQGEDDVTFGGYPLEPDSEDGADENDIHDSEDDDDDESSDDEENDDNDAVRVRNVVSEERRSVPAADQSSSESEVEDQKPKKRVKLVKKRPCSTK